MKWSRTSSASTGYQTQTQTALPSHCTVCCRPSSRTLIYAIKYIYSSNLQCTRLPTLQITASVSTTRKPARRSISSRRLSTRFVVDVLMTDWSVCSSLAAFFSPGYCILIPHPTQPASPFLAFRILILGPASLPVPLPYDTLLPFSSHLKRILYSSISAYPSPSHSLAL